MSSHSQQQLGDFYFPAADDESDDTDEWLDCGHPPANADEHGQCVVCNLSGAVERDADTKTELTRDQAAPSPFDGGQR